MLMHVKGHWKPSMSMPIVTPSLMDVSINGHSRSLSDLVSRRFVN